jgi:hypothetical protein
MTEPSAVPPSTREVNAETNPARKAALATMTYRAPDPPHLVHNSWSTVQDTVLA